MSQTIDNNKIKQAHITVVPDDTMPDYHKDPYAISMLEKARAFLKKAGLPEGWNKKTEIQ